MLTKGVASTAAARSWPAPWPASTRRCGTSPARLRRARAPAARRPGPGPDPDVRLGGRRRAQRGRRDADQRAGRGRLHRGQDERQPAGSSPIASVGRDRRRRRARGRRPRGPRRPTATSPSTSTAASASPTPAGWRRCWSRTGRSSLEEPVVPGEHAPAARGRVRHDDRRSPPVSGSTAGRNSCPSLQAGIAVAQPDLSHAGGISEVRRIASLAETYERPARPALPARARSRSPPACRWASRRPTS